MARLAERLPENVAGEVYVDRTCIDCATCRQLAPETFTAGDGFSFVHRQPDSDAARHRASMALVACPTGSIGTVSRRDAKPAMRAFPERVDGEVYFCGYTSKDSFGAWSYLLRRDAGNVLVDSPRAAGPLLTRLDELGGVRLLALTHRDDVADHRQIAKRFGCERVLHARDVTEGTRDVTEGTRDVERKPDGDEAVALLPDLLMIPTPGHTRGHAVFLYQDRYLLTGDHLAWSERRGHLVGFRTACWYSWPEQIRSMERLLDHSFEWVLPGHGQRYHAPSAAAMRTELERCIRWMKSAG